MKNAKKTNLGAIFDAHVRHEFVDRDVTATMKTMTNDPYVHNVPTLTGGDGHAGVIDFYTHHFVGKMPPDTRIEQISRTVGKDQVVDDPHGIVEREAQRLKTTAIFTSRCSCLT